MSMFTKGDQSVGARDPKANQEKTRDAAHEPIPSDILSAVRVMGDPESAGRPTASDEKVPVNLPIANASAAPSPFLGSQTPPVPKKETLPLKTASTPSGNRMETSETIGSREFHVENTPLPLRTSSPERNPPLAPPRITEPSQAVPGGGGANRSSGGKKVVLLVVGLIVVLFASGGGYYFWQNQKTQEELGQAAPQAPAPPISPVAPTQPTPQAPLKTLPYALDKPNYLSLDTEAIDAAGVKQKIDEAAARIVEGKIEEPIEFVITDKNNNPLAFSRFAYLMNMTLPAELLAEVNETFSFFISAESGRATFGLGLSLKDVAKASTAITENEAGLPKNFQPLLYGPETVVPASVPFKPSPLKAETRIVRYHNFSQNPNISFDYTVSGNRWYIGTTQNMFRMILEKSE